MSNDKLLLAKLINYRKIPSISCVYDYLDSMKYFSDLENDKYLICALACALQINYLLTSQWDSISNDETILNLRKDLNSWIEAVKLKIVDSTPFYTPDNCSKIKRLAFELFQKMENKLFNFPSLEELKAFLFLSDILSVINRMGKILCEIKDKDEEERFLDYFNYTLLISDALKLHEIYFKNSFTFHEVYTFLEANYFHPDRIKLVFDELTNIIEK